MLRSNGQASRSSAAVELPATVEGGDTVWLDEETLLVGIGYRTNPASLDALRGVFPGVEVIAFDLPHWNGAGEVMHLMSFISPLDRDLALVYPRIAPTRLMWLLAERGIETVEVPDEEFETQGPNVLALGPRRALALDGNDRDAPPHGACRRRRRHLQGRRDLAKGRRRADVPHAAAVAGVDVRGRASSADAAMPVTDVTSCLAPVWRRSSGIVSEIRLNPCAGRAALLLGGRVRDDRG